MPTLFIMLVKTWEGSLDASMAKHVLQQHVVEFLVQHKGF